MADPPIPGNERPPLPPGSGGRGAHFNKPGSRYRVYVICDRLGWQANVVRYGSWTTKGGYLD